MCRKPPPTSAKQHPSSTTRAVPIYIYKAFFPRMHKAPFCASKSPLLLQQKFPGLHLQKALLHVHSCPECICRRPSTSTENPSMSTRRLLHPHKAPFDICRKPLLCQQNTLSALTKRPSICAKPPSANARRLTLHMQEVAFCISKKPHPITQTFLDVQQALIASYRSSHLHTQKAILLHFQ